MRVRDYARARKEGNIMAANALFFGWTRSIPGREKISAEHFQQFSGYLEGLKSNGTITSYDPVFLRPHGGDLTGFFLIKGDSQKLHALSETSEWMDHMIRATHHLDGMGCVFADTGSEVPTRMAQWSKAIPRS
jgi:hypothetical protein